MKTGRFNLRTPCERNPGHGVMPHAQATSQRAKAAAVTAVASAARATVSFLSRACRIFSLVSPAAASSSSRPLGPDPLFADLRGTLLARHPRVRLDRVLLASTLGHAATTDAWRILPHQTRKHARVP